MEIEQPSKIKLIIWSIVILTGCLLVGNIIYSTYIIWRRQDLVVSRKETLKRLEEEQIELKNKLSNSLKSDFIEQEARNKLGFARDGEVIVLLPDSTKSAQVKELPVQKEAPIWKEWVELFFF